MTARQAVRLETGGVPQERSRRGQEGGRSAQEGPAEQAEKPPTLFILLFPLSRFSYFSRSLLFSPVRAFRPFAPVGTPGAVPEAAAGSRLRL